MTAVQEKQQGPYSGSVKEKKNEVKIAFRVKANKISEIRRFQGMILFIKKMYLYDLMNIVYNNMEEEYFENYAVFNIPEEKMNQFVKTIALLSVDFQIQEYIEVNG